MDGIKLPKPGKVKSAALFNAMANRESRRAFGPRALTVAELGAVLWAAGGEKETHPGGRVPPSAGACYPLDVYVSIRSGGVEGISEGIYLYQPAASALKRIAEGDFSEEIADACHGQKFTAKAQAAVLLAAEFERTTYKYGSRGVRYVYMDAGHAGGNMYLAAEGLGLATCAVGALSDEALKAAFRLPKELTAVYLFPVGARTQNER